jgi:hypothetical protein
LPVKGSKHTLSSVGLASEPANFAFCIAISKLCIAISSFKIAISGFCIAMQSF